MSELNQIKEKYKGKKLIIPDYYSPQKEYYSVNDLDDFEMAKHYLGELVSHEASITEDGIAFLKDVYGFSNLSRTLFNEKWFEDEFKSFKEIEEWLGWLEKNTITTNPSDSAVIK
jgi:hypothetical protein